jgi:hypothetical protein
MNLVVDHHFNGDAKVSFTTFGKCVSRERRNLYPTQEIALRATQLAVLTDQGLQSRKLCF